MKTLFNIRLMKQKFSTEPSMDGRFNVIRWNELKQKWETLKNETYPTEVMAIERCRKLNEQYREECSEFPEQNS